MLNLSSARGLSHRKQLRDFYTFREVAVFTEKLAVSKRPYHLVHNLIFPPKRKSEKQGKDRKSS